MDTPIIKHNMIESIVAAASKLFTVTNSIGLVYGESVRHNLSPGLGGVLDRPAFDAIYVLFKSGKMMTDIYDAAPLGPSGDDVMDRDTVYRQLVGGGMGCYWFMIVDAGDPRGIVFCWTPSSENI